MNIFYKITFFLVFSFYLYSVSSNDLSKDEKKQYDFAYNLYQNKKNKEALHYFKEFIAVYQKSILKSLVYTYIAELEYQNQNYSQAIYWLDEIYSIELYSTRGLEAMYKKATILDEIGKVQKAIQLLDKIINIDPNSYMTIKAKSKKKMIQKLETVK